MKYFRENTTTLFFFSVWEYSKCWHFLYLYLMFSLVFPCSLKCSSIRHRHAYMNALVMHVACTEVDFPCGSVLTTMCSDGPLYFSCNCHTEDVADCKCWSWVSFVISLFLDSLRWDFKKRQWPHKCKMDVSLYVVVWEYW